MTKEEFLRTLKAELEKQSISNIESMIEYYDEMICDRMEDGMSEEAAVESMDSIPVPRLSFIVANKHLEEDIARLLKKNPKMQFVIYTLELNILSGIKELFAKYGIENMEVTQITVSKTDKNSIFVTQPSPWLITGEVL